MSECTEPDPVEVDITCIEVKACDFDSIRSFNPYYDESQTILMHNRFALIVTADISATSVYSPGRLTYPITDIKIITLNRFSEKYPAGSIVNAAFGVTNMSLAYLGLPWPERGNADAFISNYYFPLYYIIRTLPEPGEHQFRIEYTLSNGNVLAAETPLFTLQ